MPAAPRGLQTDLDAGSSEERDELLALRERERRFRILSGLSNDYCFVAQTRNGALHVEWLSGLIARITGYDEHELGSEGLWGLVSPVDRLAVQTALLRVQQGELLVHEFRITTKSGAERWLREHLRSERDAQGELIIYGAARDVTERHSSQLEQESLEAQLRQSQKMDAVGRLAGGVAHDFNNLLTVVITHCGFLLTDLPPHTQAHDDANHIQMAARRAAELTQRLLAFSRQQVLTPTVLDLNSVLRDLEPVLSALIGEGIELETSIHPAPLLLKVDRAQLEQIILNLIVNARDAMPTGGKLQVMTGNVELDADYVRTHPGAREGPHVALGVRDTGTGMSAEVLARVFEPFFTTKEQGKGTGLGLSTVYGIVQQSGGSIGVESQVGFGSTFEVFFRPATEPASREPTIRPPRELCALEATILVVEDEEGVRRGVQRILKHAGYQVLVAADPAQAIAILEDLKGTIDLLLTDVVMPMMTGAELAERVVIMRPGIKVLYMSGHAREALDSPQVREQGVEFLQKPFTRQSLLEKVHGVLAPDA
ncbi:MAG: hybrid sensor histidine kinase/response regulator [Myxococcaceae bacterium]|nr:hybrid sensor histidine kinase/response regulator [Myxococcaceae bacterium]